MYDIDEITIDSPVTPGPTAAQAPCPAPEAQQEDPALPQQPKAPVAFNINGTIFTLRYNMDKVAAFEESVCPGSSLAYLIAQSKGCLSLHALRTLFCLGLSYMNTGEAANGELAGRVFKAVVERQGFMPLCEKVIGKVYEDCPFLFRA